MKTGAIHNKIAKFAVQVILSVVVPAASPVSVFADEIGSNTGSDNFRDILLGIADFVTKLGVPVAAVAIVIGGLYFVSARGNPEKMTRARTMLTWILVGTAVVMGSVVFAQIIINFVAGLE